MIKKLGLIVFALVLATSVFAKPILKIGAAAPSFELQNLQGKTVILNTYLGNQAIILSFFASWSKTCQQEIGFLQELAEKYKQENLKVIGISYDRKLAELEDFVNKNNISLEILHDKKLKTLKDFRILILPTLFVIDQSGNINSIFVDFDKNVEEAVSKDTDQLLSLSK